MARVLVVEDEPTIRVVMREVLEETHELSLAENVRQAMEHIASYEFDVALLDKNLSDGTGLQIVERLRETQPFAESVLVTAYSTTQSAIEALKLEVFDYIQKPIPDISRISQVVENAASRSHLRREKARLLKELSESEARYQRTIDGANDGIWDWDLLTDKVFYSARWKTMMGLGAETPVQSIDDWLTRVHADDRVALRAAIDRHLSGESPQLAVEYRIHDERSASMRWMLARGQVIREGAGRPVKLAGSQTDVTERRRAQERLEYAATHDTLTGLANRALLIDRLGHSMALCRRFPETKSAVLYVDLDRFKVVNDGLGHVIGDELLYSVSRRLELCVRAVDTLARVGGDEFVVVLDGIGGEEGATAVAKRILAELAWPVRLGEHEIAAAASIGIVHLTEEYTSPMVVLRDADIAMYRAKATRAGFVVFDKSLSSRAHDVLALQSALRTAVDRNELRCHYQPVVSLDANRVSGFEVLVRWQHPQRGMIPPYDFIPLAEESGLIIGIGEWVLARACEQLQTWMNAGVPLDDVTLGVNLSAQQLRSSRLPDVLKDLLETTGVPARCLELEITEGTLMESVEGSAGTLRKLKDLGVRLALDDFGTGFSSLSYLHLFPIDRIKIDRSFVSDVDLLSTRREIVRAVISLGKSLGLEVVAEGVETQAQLEVLRSLGCRAVQGFLYAKPMEIAQASLLLGQALSPRAALS